MSLSFILFFGFIAVLLFGLGWALWMPRLRSELRRDPRSLEESSRRHVAYLPQIRQALSEVDHVFLSKKTSREVQLRFRKERRRVVLAYLSALRGDFQSLLRMARLIALLSPEVAAVHEYERLRLTAKFFWRYQMIRGKLLAGLAPVPQLDGLSDLVSGLSVRMEAAIKELGERAAIAAELASSLNRRGLDSI